jgi:hypothetical protein
MTTVYDPERVVLEVVLAYPSGRTRQGICGECPDIIREAIEGLPSVPWSALASCAPRQTVYASPWLQRLEQLSLIAA